MDFRPVWLRQVGERSQAFAAFELFRELGPSRTLALTAEQGFSLRTCRMWSKKYKWAARSTAYDDHVASLRAKIFHDRRMKAIDDQATLGQMMREKAVEGLEFLKPEDMGAYDVAKLAETGVKIERLAYGDSTENAKTGPQQIQFVLGTVPPWAQHQTEVQDAINSSIPADPNSRILSADTMNKLEERNG